MIKHTISKSNVIEALQYLASYEFQRIAWFENNQGLMYSFNENVSDLFDDYDLDKALQGKAIVFTKKADIALRELSNVVDAIDGFLPEDELINSPEMQIVRQKAAHALALIKTSDGSQSTVDIME